MEPALVQGVDVAVGHLLPVPHPVQPGLACHPLGGRGLPTLPSRFPAPASKHLDGIGGQGSPTRLVQVEEVEVLLLEPPQLPAVRLHLALDVSEELGPHLTDHSGADENLLVVLRQRCSEGEGQLSLISLRLKFLIAGNTETSSHLETRAYIGQGVFRHSEHVHRVHLHRLEADHVDEALVEVGDVLLALGHVLQSQPGGDVLGL